MTTIKELIELLTRAGDKLGYDMPVILEPNIDCRDADGDVFSAWDVMNDDLADLFLDIREAQVGKEWHVNPYPNGKEEEIEVAYYDYWNTEGIPESDKKKVLCISSPSFKYGSDENNF